MGLLAFSLLCLLVVAWFAIDSLWTDLQETRADREQLRAALTATRQALREEQRS